MKLITDVLRDIRKGRAVEEASRKLAEVVSSVIETGKAGKISIELTIKPQKNDSEQVVISTKVTAKRPEDELPDAIFFVDAEGGLHRTDPTQREMFEAADGRGRAAAAE